MRTRKHHNNNGHRQIKEGGSYDRLKKIAKKLRIKFWKPNSE